MRILRGGGYRLVADRQKSAAASLRGNVCLGLGGSQRDSELLTAVP
jgi:hypothetical protein